MLIVYVVPYVHTRIYTNTLLENLLDVINIK
jgi:hypothetical protein